MSKNPFQVGDHVRVYGYWNVGGYGSCTGVIIEEHGKGFRIKTDMGPEISAHAVP